MTRLVTKHTQSEHSGTRRRTNTDTYSKYNIRYYLEYKSFSHNPSFRKAIKMVTTRQSSKASTSEHEVAGPSTVALDSEYESASDRSSSPEKPPKKKALVEYIPSAIIEEPSDLKPSTLKDKDMDLVALRHGIPRDSLLLPAIGQSANNPPEGYIAWSCYHCSAGGIPPLNGFLINILNYIECAPFQLHPNSVAILTSLYVIFQTCYHREPQPQEIRYLYTLRTSRTTSASVISLEGRNTKVIEGIKSNVGPYKAQWFFVRDPAPC